jgi:hypothetical protein
MFAGTVIEWTPARIAAIDCCGLPVDNDRMEIQGVVQNGVVVLEGSVALPEGAVVTVTVRTKPEIRVAKAPQRVDFPIFPSDTPGSIPLTNERIAQILEEEDIESVKQSGNVPS